MQPVPDEMIAEIARHCNYRTWQSLCCVSQRVNALCLSPEVRDHIMGVEFFRWDHTTAAAASFDFSNDNHTISCKLAQRMCGFYGPTEGVWMWRIRMEGTTPPVWVGIGSRRSTMGDDPAFCANGQGTTYPWHTDPHLTITSPRKLTWTAGESVVCRLDVDRRTFLIVHESRPDCYAYFRELPACEPEQEYVPIVTVGGGGSCIVHLERVTDAALFARARAAVGDL